jgi:hypothetical protein
VSVYGGGTQVSVYGTQVSVYDGKKKVSKFVATKFQKETSALLNK